jgi:hypothetical protein
MTSIASSGGARRSTVNDWDSPTCDCRPMLTDERKPAYPLADETPRWPARNDNGRDSNRRPGLVLGLGLGIAAFTCLNLGIGRLTIDLSVHARSQCLNAETVDDQNCRCGRHPASKERSKNHRATHDSRGKPGHKEAGQPHRR